MVFTISKTAKDAIQAKLSALQAGYQLAPLSSETNDNDNDNYTTTRCTTNSYAELLSRMAVALDCSTTKRQTPLVNAGYAIRVTTLLHQIHTYMMYGLSFLPTAEASSTRQTLQVVVLGAGLDVTGLWCLEHQRELPSMNDTDVHVIEIDMPDVCATKREALRRMDVTTGKYGINESIKEIPSSIESNTSSVFLDIDIPDDGRESGWGCGRQRYTILSADLAAIESVRQVLDGVLSKDDSTHTIIISEVVLAYLGRQPSQNLLEYCAKDVLSSKTNACLIMWEPIGFSSSDNPAAVLESTFSERFQQNPHTTNVIHGYQQVYFDHFCGKLRRGVTQSTLSEPESDATPTTKPGMAPLAVDCGALRDCLIEVGFTKAYTSTAGSAAKAISRRVQTRGNSSILTCSEDMDEHAGLVLFLHSYALVISFGLNADRILCDQMKANMDSKIPSSLPRRLEHLKSKSSSRTFWLTIASGNDDSSIRELFEEAYQHLYSDFPSVAKMAKKALKTDLSGTSASSSSCIGEYYRNEGGTFLVVLEATGAKYRVVGALGITPQIGNSSKIGDISSRVQMTYEVRRLLVHSDYRRNGLGSELLNTARTWVSTKHMDPFFEQEVHLVATTLTLLEPANMLYQNHGFHVVGDDEVSNLVLRTYARKVESLKQV